MTEKNNNTDTCSIDNELNKTSKRKSITPLTERLRLSYDLIPAAHFPYLTAKGKQFNVPENIDYLLRHYDIQVRFNLVRKQLEIAIPHRNYSKTNEINVKLSDIAALCIKNGGSKMNLSL